MFPFFNRTKEKTKSKKLPKAKQPGIEVTIDGRGTRALLKFGNSQHIGDRRNQEDSFGYSSISGSEISEKGVLAVLADGMGGLSYGKQISEYVVSASKAMFEKLDYTMPFPEQLENIVRKINSTVCENFSSDGKSNAGSTMVAAFVYKTRLYWACVGDSRLYLLREGLLYQINEDHDYFNEMMGQVMHDDMLLEEAKNHEEKDSLTSYIGSERLPYIDLCKRGFALQKQDKLVLCSDGIYNGMSNAELVGYLKDEPQSAADRLVRNTVKNKLPSQDNMTVMVIEYS
jgi:protein phosphatase